MNCVDIIRFHDEKERMLGICAIPPNELDPFDTGVVQRIGAPLFPRTRFGSVYLRNVE